MTVNLRLFFEKVPNYGVLKIDIAQKWGWRPVLFNSVFCFLYPIVHVYKVLSNSLS